MAWKFRGPQQIRTFIWTILQWRVLSNVERVRRGISDDPSCHICDFHSKDILHILRDCPAVKDVWAQVNPGWSMRGELVGIAYLDCLFGAYGKIRIYTSFKANRELKRNSARILQLGNTFLLFLSRGPFWMSWSTCWSPYLWRIGSSFHWWGNAIRLWTYCSWGSCSW